MEDNSGQMLNSNESTVKSLGTWFYDKRKKRKVYISLTGQKFTGSEALRKAKSDSMYEKQRAFSVRSELQHNISILLENFGHDTRFENLSTWGLPDKVTVRYQRRKVSKLFDWQVECLLTGNGKSFLERRNLIYSAPTSGGKTLVAEVLMLRQLGLRESGTTFFVVPFVALAEEKTAYFQDIWSDMQIGVKSFHNNEDGESSVLGTDVDVAVCTIERANILFTQLLSENRENQLKMVVIDEIHLLSDPHRGFLLEVLLTKIKYIMGDKVQIVGMSATLPNIQDLASWLNASLYITEYRPVQLSTAVCYSQALYGLNSNASDKDVLQSVDSKFVLQRPVPPATPSSSTSDDGLFSLCNETICAGNSVIVFCSSKKRCETCCTNIADSLKSIQPAASVFQRGDSKSAAIHRSRLQLVELLSQTSVGLCPVLKQSLIHGVAYHHAGLTVDERRIIEEGFRAGSIQVLCTTSTLSAGVNLPAQRVIIRSLKMGDQFINVATFRQMCGRAGRLGYDVDGEAILMIANSKAEKEQAHHLLTAELDPLRSTLHVGNGGGIEKLLLEVISCGRVTREQEVMAFIGCSLMNVQLPGAEVIAHTRDALLFLRQEQFILASSENVLQPSPLGVATTLSGLSPKDAVYVLQPLLQARAKLILKSGLHPIFLVTPPGFSSIEPNWAVYERVLDVLYQEHPETRDVVAHLGISHAQLCTFAFHPPPLASKTPTVQLYRRVYVAILLFVAIQEWPITRILKLVSNVTRGQIQQLQKDASIFCGMIVVFCRKLNWTLLASCLEEYGQRLNFGTHPDVIPLVRLGSEITAVRARILYKSDICCAADIVRAGYLQLSELLLDSMPFHGREVLEQQAQETDRPRSADENGADVNEGAKSREVLRPSCERLARRIVMRAEECLREELFQLQNSTTF